MDLILELEIPARAEFVAIARLVVASLATARRALADERIDDLKLAVSEACTNAVEAHDAIGSSAHVRIRVWEGDERLEVAIDDSGGGFDPASLPAHPPVTDPERLNFERGLGIPLIRTLVDDVEFVTSSGGTSVRLTLYGGPAELEYPGDTSAEATRYN
jgi:serine/threonine-protein kinase RsbW